MTGELALTSTSTDLALVPSPYGAGTVPLITPAEEEILRYLNGLNNTNTRRGYALDIGLSNHLRAGYAANPARLKPLPGSSWLPWAITHDLDPIGELEVEHVQSWVHALHAEYPGKSNATERRRWAAVCGFYGHLRRRKLVYCDLDDLIGGRLGRKNIGLRGSTIPITLPYSTGQVRALYLAAQLDTTQHHERNRAMIGMLAATGCRVEELVGLDLDDYQRTGPGQHAMVRLHGKGDQTRWQKLPAADADLVDAYLHVRVAPAGSTELAIVGQVSNRPAVPKPLFTTRTGARLHVDTVAPLLCRIANLPTPDHPLAPVRLAARELAPIKDRMRPHPLRHSYVVTATNNGIPISQTQQDVGHVSLATTQLYLTADNTGKNSAAQTVSDIYHAGEINLAVLEQ